MKKLFHTILSIVLFVSAGGAQEIYIDFGVNSMTTKDAADTWNNAVWGGPGDTSQLPLKDNKGAAAGISVVRVGGFLGAFDTGENEQSLYPATAGKDRWSLERGKADTGKIRFSGLESGQQLTIQFFGTRDAPVEFITKFDSQGKSASINCQNNRDKVATLTGLKPDSQGNVDVNLSIVSGPNGHLSVAVVTIEGSPQTKASPAPQVTPKPAPAKPTPAKPTPAKTKVDSELAALGLDEEEESSALMIAGVVLILAGLAVIGVSIWYYLRPEKVEQPDED